MLPGGAAWPGCGRRAQSPHSPAPLLPVHIFHEGFPARPGPLLPAKPLCAPTSWLASASINTSSLRGLGLWGQELRPPPPAPACSPRPAPRLPLTVPAVGPGSPEGPGAGRGPSPWTPGRPREELEALCQAPRLLGGCGGAPGSTRSTWPVVADTVPRTVLAGWPAGAWPAPGRRGQAAQGFHTLRTSADDLASSRRGPRARLGEGAGGERGSPQLHRRLHCPRVSVSCVTRLKTKTNAGSSGDRKFPRWQEGSRSQPGGLGVP